MNKIHCSVNCNICGGIGYYWNGEGYEECPKSENFIYNDLRIIDEDINYKEKYPHLDTENFDKENEKDD